MPIFGWSTAAVKRTGPSLCGSFVYRSIVPHQSLCRQLFGDRLHPPLSRPTQPWPPWVRCLNFQARFDRTACVGQQTRGIGVGKVGMCVTDGGLRSDWHCGFHGINWFLILVYRSLHWSKTVCQHEKIQYIYVTWVHWLVLKVGNDDWKKRNET